MKGRILGQREAGPSPPNRLLSQNLLFRLLFRVHSLHHEIPNHHFARVERSRSPATRSNPLHCPVNITLYMRLTSFSFIGAPGVVLSHVCPDTLSNKANLSLLEGDIVSTDFLHMALRTYSKALLSGLLRHSTHPGFSVFIGSSGAA